MRVLAVAAIVLITSLAVPAFAEEDPAKAEQQKKKENKEIEEAYKNVLKRTTREQPVKKADPWGSVR
jgi:hypothetical protein